MKREKKKKKEEMMKRISILNIPLVRQKRITASKNMKEESTNMVKGERRGRDRIFACITYVQTFCATNIS